MTEPTQRRTETRKRILDTAGRLFRQQGIDGVGVDAVMKEAGLTHGGFYLHFSSKEALAAEVAQSLLEQAAGNWSQISRSPDRRGALTKIVTAYLDPDRVSTGRCCLLATLGADVARRDASRGAIHMALDNMIQALARCLPGGRRQRALATLSTLVGAVVLARLANDPVLAQDFLDAAAASILPAGRSGATVTPLASAAEQPLA